MTNKVTYIAIYFLIISLTMYVSETISYYSSNQVSSDNSIHASILDMDIEADEQFLPNEEMSIGDTQTKSFTVLNLGKDGFPYKLTAQNVSGDTELCNVLQANLKFLDDSTESGFMALQDLTFEVNEISGDELYDLEVKLPDDSPQESLAKTCTFDIVLNAWTDGFGETEVFYDTEEFSNVISSSGAVVDTLDEPLVVEETTESTESLPL